MATVAEEEIKALKRKLEQKQDEVKSLRRKMYFYIERDSKHGRFEENLKNKVECPVCLEVPRRGPVSVCPNGHLVCRKCKGETCPVCRSPMGTGRSLLANLVIEQVDHSCKHEGCEHKLPVEDIEEHEVNCVNRKVKCPNLECGVEMTLQELVDHLAANEAGCCDEDEDRGLEPGEWVRQIYIIPDLTQGDLQWPLNKLHMMYDIYSIGNFVLRLTKSVGQVFFSIIMLSSEEVSSGLVFEMVIESPEARDKDLFVKFSGNTFSIDQAGEELSLYGVNDKLLAKIVENAGDGSSIWVSFKILEKDQEL